MPAKDMARYMRERRSKRRDKLITLLGGKCIVCGTEEELEFDHRDRTQKSFTLSGRGLDTKWETLLSEVDKCDLLCKQHHLQKSQQAKDFGQVGHGEGKSGKKNCPCSLCKERKAEYMRSYTRPSRQKE